MQSRQIIVTGSSSGIGKAITKKMLDVGIKVIGLARNHEKFNLKSVDYVPISVDLSDRNQLDAIIKKLIIDFPDLNGIVSNAGFGRFGSLETFSPRQIEKFINLNLTSHIIITSLLLPHFKRKNNGDVIIIGSEASISGGRKGSLYCAAKFGLRGFSQSIREESSDRNIRVSLINPGMVRTPFFDDLDFKPGEDLSNAIDPHDIAELVSLILTIRPGTVIDEINLSPLKKSITFS